ncbi:MAG: sigma-E processing peptidase SpoIIGA [Ruthenibacterium sp.]
MRGVIYVDILVLVNALLGYFLLKGAALLAGSAQKPLRLCMGALASGFSALSLLLVNLPWGVAILLKAACACGIVRIAYPYYHWRLYVKSVFYFVALNIALGGVVLLAMKAGANVTYSNFTVYLHVSPVLLIVCIAGMYFVVQAVTMLCGKPVPQQKIAFALTLDDKTIQGKALLDTGFCIKDAITGKQVFLLSYPMVQKELSARLCESLHAYFTQGVLQQTELSLYLLPVKTATGMRPLPAMAAMSAVLNAKKCSRITAAFTPEEFAQGEFSAIAHAELSEYQ